MNSVAISVDLASGRRFSGNARGLTGCGQAFRGNVHGLTTGQMHLAKMSVDLPREQMHLAVSPWTYHVDR